MSNASRGAADAPRPYSPTSNQSRLRGRITSDRLSAVELSPEACEVIQSGRLAHLVTLNRDGSPQVSCVWVDVDGDEIVSAHLFEQQKLRNVRRDPRVSLSIEADNPENRDLQPYLVVHGRGRITEGGAPELLNRLGRRYLGRDDFPPMPNPPAGFVLRIEVERVGGMGPWAPR